MNASLRKLDSGSVYVDRPMTWRGGKVKLSRLKRLGEIIRVSTLLLVLQWIVSLIGVFGGVGLIIYRAFKEDWKLGVVGFLFLPFLVYYIPTRWAKCRNPTIVFAVGAVAATLLQRARLGYWAWPDVEA